MVKPAVFPVAHLRKYAEVQGGPSTSSSSSAGGDGSSNRVVIGPCMLSCHVGAKLVGDRSGYRKLIGLFKDSGSDASAGDLVLADVDPRKRQKRSYPCVN